MRGRWGGFHRAAGVALAGVVASSCGTATSTSPTTTGGAPHTFPYTIMILDGQPLPQQLTIAVGERVSFMNHDRTTYTIAGGSQPAGPDCAEIGMIGVLASGDTRTTEPFTTAKTCDFHISRDTSAALTGRIIIR